MAESEEELKSLLMKVKENEKAGFKTHHSKNTDHDIQSHQFMTDRWGKQWEQWWVLFSGSKSLQMVTAAMKLKDTCPQKESYDKPRQRIKKQRHHFADKVLYSQSYGISSSESWIIKKVEHQMLDAFELWCWRRLLRVTWTARGLNQLILKEISPDYSLEGLMLKLKLQYFGHLMWKDDSLRKDPDVGKDWRQEEKEMTEDEMVGWPHQLSRHKFEHTLGDDEGRGSLASAVHGATRVRHYWVTEQQQPSALALLAAAAKSSQSCPTLCDPIDSSPPGSPVPGILQARMLEWVAISFSNA